MSAASRRISSVRLALVAILITCATLVSARPVQAATRFTVSIYDGSVVVDNMTATPQSRVAWLIRRADNSTCNNDGAVDCNGIMTTGDRVLVAENYMALIDLTYSGSGPASFGGGLLKGVWMLITDATGQKTFKYWEGGKRVPNNLRTGQIKSTGGAVQDILAQPEGACDPCGGTFSASNARSITIGRDGWYNPYLNTMDYLVTGYLTLGNGETNLNVGKALTPSYIWYSISYTFYNSGPYDIYASAQLQGCTGVSDPCGNTLLRAAVFDLQISHTTANSMRVNYWKPAQGMKYGASNNPHACGAQPDLPANGTYAIPAATQNYWYTGYQNSPTYFGAKFKVDSGNTLTNFRINVFDNDISSNYTGKEAFQLVYDNFSKAIAYDTKVGGECGPFLFGPNPPGPNDPPPPHGNEITWYQKLDLDYTTP